MMRTICRCCGSEALKTYLDLGEQPLANAYHKGTEPLPTYPLRVNFCTSCHHSQLSHVVPPDLMFRNYLYVSGTTKTLKDHFRELAQYAVGDYLRLTGGDVGRRLRVLDIACNDGTLLESFRGEFGCDVLGVDPSENLREITIQKQIPVVVDYWSKKLAQTLKPFDIITAANVFAHVDDVYDFLEGCKGALKPDGIVIIEVPYAADMLRKREFDTIYHEHLSYFLVRSFEYAIWAAGFFIDLVQWRTIHGGSMRLTLKIGMRGPEGRVAFYRDEEARIGLASEHGYANFQYEADRIRKDFYEALKENAERRIVGYGASAKGNTALNFFGTKLDYIVDDNPMKHGYMTPGMDIPIRSPSALSEDKRDLAIVILSWNFAKEIARKIAALRPGRTNDRVIVYVPRVRSVPLADAAVAFAEVSA